MELTKENSERLAALAGQLKLRLHDLKGCQVGRLDNEFYIYQWLQAHNFNVTKTEAAIRKCFSWRQENKVQGSIDQLSPDLVKSFPANVDTLTMTGRPICCINAALWEIRRCIESGDKDQVRHFFSLWALKIEDIWLKSNVGKKPGDSPINFLHLINCKGISLNQFASPGVLSVCMETGRNISTYFPPMIGDIFLINFSKAYYLTFKVIKPFFTFAPLHVFDSNEDKWQKALTALVDLQKIGLQSENQPKC